MEFSIERHVMNSSDSCHVPINKVSMKCALWKTLHGISLLIVFDLSICDVNYIFCHLFSQLKH